MLHFFFFLACNNMRHHWKNEVQKLQWCFAVYRTCRRVILIPAQKFCECISAVSIGLTRHESVWQPWAGNQSWPEIYIAHNCFLIMFISIELGRIGRIWFSKYLHLLDKARRLGGSETCILHACIGIYVCNTFIYIHEQHMKEV